MVRRYLQWTVSTMVAVPRSAMRLVLVWSGRQHGMAASVAIVAKVVPMRQLYSTIKTGLERAALFSVAVTNSPIVAGAPRAN
jgi:23S rRNA C2498 (ribose-2'-O)-methylase RlmM